MVGATLLNYSERVTLAIPLCAAWWVLDIIEHNWNTHKTETTVDKAL